MYNLFKNFSQKFIKKTHSICSFSITNNFDEESEPTVVHSPVHEEKERTRPGFQCFICNTSFTDKNNLNTHLAEVHEGKNLNTKTVELNTNMNPNLKIKTEESNLNTQIAEVYERKNIDEKT